MRLAQKLIPAVPAAIFLIATKKYQCVVFAEQERDNQQCIFTLKLSHSVLLVSPKLDLDSNSFEESTVQINNEITTDLSQRNSHIHLKKFYLSNKKLSELSAELDVEDPSAGPWNLLKYETGQYFHSHTDTKESENHLYTALLLPSNSFSRYTGGELFIHDKPSFDESTVKMVISCADLDKDTFVVFPIGFYHEVLPVLEGVRYVFKKPLSVKVVREYFPLSNSSQATVSEDVMIRLKKQHESRSLPAVVKPNSVDLKHRHGFPSGNGHEMPDSDIAWLNRVADGAQKHRRNLDVSRPESVDSRSLFPMGEKAGMEDGDAAVRTRRRLEEIAVSIQRTRSEEERLRQSIGLKMSDFDDSALNVVSDGAQKHRRNLDVSSPKSAEARKRQSCMDTAFVVADGPQKQRK